MICGNCQASIADDSRFCSSCGSSSIGNVGSDLERQLAEANLLRLRKQWDDAEARCVDVLRGDPENVHAHSLLGDIFRDQGKLAEASQWYEMALDLDPNSANDKRKRQQADRELAHSPPPRRMAHAGPGVPIGGTQRLMGVIPPVFVIRGLTAVSVVFAIIVVVLLIASRSNNRLASQAGASSEFGRPLPVPRPVFTQPSPVPAGVPANPGRRPNVVPQASGFTQQEIALRTKLARAADLGADFSIGALTIDPQVHRINLVLQYLVPDAPPETARVAILRASATAAQALFGLDPSTQTVGVNVQMESSPGRAETVFGGQINRSIASKLPAGAGLDALSGAFTETWWTPVMSPDANPSGAPEGIH